MRQRFPHDRLDRFKAIGCACCVFLAFTVSAAADSVNSPNITLNVDTNRGAGNGAGGVFVTVNTITIAETMLPEYSAGAGREIRLRVRPGYQLDPASPITCQSATIGFNGLGINVAATVTPTGSADEEIVFALTSGTSATVQDILRINGAKVRILSAAGAAGPAQTTLQITTVPAGGAFTNQGIVAANITRGAADRLVFATQPGTTQSGVDLLPAVRVVDFGGNTVNNDARAITLALQSNPGGAALLGNASRTTDAGVATWMDADDLRILPAAAGYTLRASHSGGGFLSSDTVDSAAFEITAGAPNRLSFVTQPADAVAGEPILVSVSVLDAADNLVTGTPVDVTLDAAVNPAGWPLLVDTSVTKTTANGVAVWQAADNLRINRAVADYRLSASGVNSPIISEPFDITAAAPAALRFVQPPSEAQEGDAIDPPVTVEIVDEFNNRTNAALGVALQLDSDCGGTLLGGQATASAGLATFNALQIDTACNGIQLEAASGNLVRASSGIFTITELPGASLRFVQQPTSVVEGVAFNPPVAVEILDAAGRRSSSDAQVQLTLLSACGGVLSSASSVAVGGLATFGILSIDTPCTNVTLQATASGLTGTTSTSFEIVAAEDNTPAPACGACGPVSLVTMLPFVGVLLARRSRHAAHHVAG